MGVITTAVATLFGGDPTTAFIASVATAVALFATWFLWRLNTKDGARDQTAPPFIWKEVPPSDHVPGQDPAPGAHSRLSSTRLPVEEQRVRSKAFYNLMASRRSLRFFSSDPIDQEVLDTVVATAGTAPSGAHKQPWVFCVVKDPQARMEIRKLVEAEEAINYERRMKKTWVQVSCRAFKGDTDISLNFESRFRMLITWSTPSTTMGCPSNRTSPTHPH
eukprot:m.49999 g.49999  ORF g.49999 m.49999 type:complete len:219 (+) comp8988_c0_seq3:172-828(+)